MRRFRLRWSHVLAFGPLLLFGTPAATVAIWWWGFAQPRQTVDYWARFEAAGRSVQPAGPNAWPRYEPTLDPFRKIVEAPLDPKPGPPQPPFDVGSLKPRTYGDALFELPQGEWDDPRHAKGKEALRRLEPILRQVEAAASAPGFLVPRARPADPPVVLPSMGGGMALVPDTDHLTALMKMASTLRGAMRADAEAHDWDRLQSRFRACLRLSRHLTLEPNIFAWSTGVSVRWLALEEVRLVLNERAVPPEVCNGLLAILASEPWPAAPVGHAMQRMELSTYEAVQLFHQQAWYWTLLSSARHGHWFPTHAAGKAHLDRFFQRLEAWWALPADQRSVAPLQRWQRSLEQDVAGLITGDLAAIAPDLRDRLDVPASLDAATEFMLRLEIHHARTGAWPDSPEDAMPRQATIEPISGQPFIYRRTPDDLHGRPYVAEFPTSAPVEVTEINPPRRGFEEDGSNLDANDGG